MVLPYVHLHIYIYRQRHECRRYFPNDAGPNARFGLSALLDEAASRAMLGLQDP